MPSPHPHCARNRSRMCRVTSSASTQPPLTLNQQAQFASNDYAFTSGINDIQIQNNQTIIVTITVVNTGTKGMTLSVYPTFNDPVGQSFPGAAIFFSQISPNYKSTQKGTIYIPPGELNILPRDQHSTSNTRVLPRFRLKRRGVSIFPTFHRR